jgi:hypothetical protein
MGARIAAKPIIDIDVVVRTESHVLPRSPVPR